MSDLLELAERCEKATEGSSSLDREILNVLGYSWRGMGWWYRDDSHQWKGNTALTRSIDAAMSLIPEGWDYSLVRDRLDNSACIYCPAWAEAELPASAKKGLVGQWKTGIIDAATPALALTAAALRARALASEEEKG